MDSLRRSFKSYGSLSFSSFDQEEQPILLEDPPDDGDRREVVVKIDSTSRDVLDRQPSIPVTNSNNVMVWREPSYEFWKENGAGSRRGSRDGGGGGFSFSNQRRRPQPRPMTEIAEDPPSRRISSFLHKQRSSGNDVDLEMEELMKPSPNGSKDLHVSSQNTPSEPHSSRGSYRSPSSFDGDKQHDPRRPKVSPSHAGEVLRCTSNASLTVPSTLHSKTRSRLIDPPPPATAAGDGNKKSGQFSSSGPIKSGILGKAQASSSEGDEDPFVDEDIPNEFKRAKFDLLTILQWVSLIPLVAALACSLSIPALKRQTVWGLHLWKWELLFYVLICGRLVSGWFIRIVVFFIERNFTLRKRVLYFVYGVRKAMQNCLWLGLVLLSWHYMLGKKAARETKSKTLPYVTNVLFCVLMACAFRLVKILLIKVLASSFHVSTYFDRIQESLFNQYVIETLSGPPMVELQSAQDEEELMMAEVQRLQNEGVTIPSDLRAAALPTKRGRVIGNGKRIRLSDPFSRKDGSWQQEEEGITIDHLRKLSQKNVSAWDMKRLMRIVRDGALMTLDEQAAQERGMDEAATEIRSEYEAKAAAKKIFINAAKPGAKYIYLEDLMRFMREDEALKTMSSFEGAQEKQRVSRKSLKNWLINAFRERRALSLTLNDTKTAVNNLHHMANVIVGIIVFALCLLILGLATTHIFYLISSQALLAVFMFGNTLRSVFEAIFFLFVMHPFDIGDYCEIDNVEMCVEEMNILTTVFLKSDNQKVTYPNSKLAAKFIGNVCRSPDMWNSINFCVHVATPVEKLTIMREDIVGYIENQREDWHPGPLVVLNDVDNTNRLKITIWMRQRINFQPLTPKWDRRESLLLELIRILRELDIEYRMLPLDVNVRDMPAITSTRLPSNESTFK